MKEIIKDLSTIRDIVNRIEQDDLDINDVVYEIEKIINKYKIL